VSGFASRVISAFGSKSNRFEILVITRPTSSAGSSEGVPPPKKIVSTWEFPNFFAACSISPRAESMYVVVI